jgi:hypothetical protein|tara:strand:+ start:320 stop:514 length:195 start_codon:yes stop_codon:yes gene_type:complete
MGTPYKQKKFSEFDFGSKNQGLNNAKRKAKKDAANKINASKKGLMEKGKALNEANKEINKYTDY